MNSVTTFLKTISDENRLTALLILSRKELCVCDLQALLPLTQGALSIQLKNLSTAGLLEHSKRGKWVFYRLASKLPKYQSEILKQLFQQIQTEKKIKELLKQVNKIKRTKEDCQ